MLFYILRGISLSQFVWVTEISSKMIAPCIPVGSYKQCGAPWEMALLLTGGSIILLEKAMAPHSSTLAWKIPWTEEPGRLPSMGSLRVGHD